MTDHQLVVKARHPSGQKTYNRIEAPISMSMPLNPRVPLSFPANSLDASANDIQERQHATEQPTSTCAGILRWAAYWMTKGTENPVPDPIMALLWIFLLDSDALIRRLHSVLDNISRDSLDDYLMTRKSEHWRRLMSDLEIEIPAIGKSLRNFASFAVPRFHTGRNNANGQREYLQWPPEVHAIISDVEHKIQKLKAELDAAYVALRADMQFAESRRSIEEAKVITRLTELAFLYIPLSFTSSLFSMSIVELQNPVPVWAYIVTALAFALVSYGLRLIVASDFLADMTRQALERYWAGKYVARGDDVPTVKLLWLTFQEIWNNSEDAYVTTGIVLLVALSVLIVPVSVVLLWVTTRLGTGFDVAITLFLLFSGIFLATYTYRGHLVDP